MITHELKVLKKFYPSLLDMSKPFEIRRDDRHFAVGDKCIFREIEKLEIMNPRFNLPLPEDMNVHYTGSKCVRAITYVLSHEMFDAVPKGYVILGLKEML